MTKVVCILALPIALGIPPRQESGTVSRSLRLEPGARVAQQIALGGKDSYAIAVAPGQFLRVVIEPAGVALALALAAPDGSALATIDAARSHAPASIAIEADAAGDYTLTVRAVKEVPPRARTPFGWKSARPWHRIDPASPPSD